MTLIGRAILILFTCVLVSACGLVGTAPARDSNSSTAISGSAPRAAGPSTKPVQPTTKGSSQAGTGAVNGQIQRLDGTPLKGIIVYAAPIGSHGDQRLASVDPLVDPHETTDAEGLFGVKNLKAGEYALATQSPFGIILPHDKAGQVVTFNIAADQETGLGLLQVGYVYPDGD